MLGLWFRAPCKTHQQEHVASTVRAVQNFFNDSTCVLSNPARRDLSNLQAWRVCIGPGLDASPTRQPNNQHWWELLGFFLLQGTMRTACDLPQQFCLRHLRRQFEHSCFLQICLPIFQPLVELRRDQTWYHWDVPTSCSPGNSLAYASLQHGHLLAQTFDLCFHI